MSLAELEVLPNVFEGVELLTLSACETALGSTQAEGKEIDGLGMLAQQQGAKAVLATLWKVTDASTPEFMQTFYRLRETQVGMPKAEALRQAQLALLHGKHKQRNPELQRGVTQVTHEPRATDELNAADQQFVNDPAAPYAHPYYWAPLS